MIKTVAAGLLLFAAYQYYRSQTEGQEQALDWGSEFDSLKNAAGGLLDYAEGAVAPIMNINSMKNVNPVLLSNSNVKAFLRVVRTGEGTADENGYRRIFGGQLFSSFKDHPRILVKKNGYNSTAAGAYQAAVKTWDETKRIMGLPDFSPASQDLFALGRIMARSALVDVVEGRFEAAIRKCCWEWASLPGSPYGQPVITMAKAKQVYEAAGGKYEAV